MGILLAVAICAGYGACGVQVPHPPPAAAKHAPLKGLAVPGESGEFVLQFRGIVVGRVVVSVGEPGMIDGRHMIVYSARGQTEGLLTLLGEVRWALDTTIDLDNAVPVQSHEDCYIGPLETAEHVVRDHAEHDDGFDQDIQSAVCAMRGWHSKPGDRFTFTMDFESAHLAMDVWDAGPDRIDTTLVSAARYQGTIDGKIGFEIWFSDDVDRVPLKVKIASPYGDIVVDLVEYRAPQTPESDRATVVTGA